MATSRYQPPDPRRQVGSPKPKNRENKDTLCRNVLIYGHCRYENSGCTFNHDQNRTNSSQNSQASQNGQADFAKKTLNVDSPSFTPAGLQSAASKKTTLSSQAANAAVFTPRGAGSITPVAPQEIEAPTFNPAAIREFTPQNYDLGSNVTSNGVPSDAGLTYDPFALPSVAQGIATPAPYNPYAEDHSAMAGPSAAFYQHQNAYTAPLQPLQYHLYAPVGPHRDALLPFQRTVHDFFIPDKLREEYQRKSEATHQVMPNSQLPQLENYHSLVPLDTNTRKNTNVFGYAAWVYKATSSKNGRLFCLRRLEGYRLTNEHSIRSVKDWRQLNNGSVVTIHDAFTTRAFGDSSIIFVQDYHPMSKTLAEVHFSHVNANPGSRYQPKTAVPETIMWSYISQIANALKAVHGLGLAARCIDISKIIVTDKNRIRLSGCSIFDVLQFDVRRPVQELQQEDFIQFGKVMLSLATNTLPTQLSNLKSSLEQTSRNYSTELAETILWLLSPQQPPAQKGIDEFVRGIATRIIATTDMMMHAEDTLNSELYRELENGRLFRLVAKLGAINERPEFDGDRMWSENGERYMLKLFRDYVFHQVDAHGNPVLDLGHIVRCLNRLDAGSDDRICLTSRDDQTSFIVSYKDLKKQVGNAFGDLMKGNKHPGRSL